jgi:molybdopterin-guanine dinucleotide biosynthesis protein A
MGGLVKANLPLAGTTLLRHVIDRVAPQVGRLVLSVAAAAPEFEYTGLEQVVDPRPGHNGPLGGLLSALQWISGSYEWLLLVPCDAPFLPRNLGERLHRQALETGRAGCVARYEGVVQPTFSIWNCSLLPRLSESVMDRGVAGFKPFLEAEPQAILDWEVTEPSPFFNVNDAPALEKAECLLGSKETSGGVV